MTLFFSYEKGHAHINTHTHVAQSEQRKGEQANKRTNKREFEMKIDSDALK